MLQTRKATYDVFPPANELLYPPILGVTDVRYYDREGGTLIAVPASSYSIDIESEPGWIVAVAGVGWPDTVVAVNAVRVNYTAGYGEDAEDVPQAIRQWILLRVGHWYENREASIVGAPVEPLPFLNGLIDCYRVRRIA